MLLEIKFRFLLSLLLALTLALFLTRLWLCSCKQPNESSVDEEIQTAGKNVLLVYTGAWKLLRLQLPHVFRELKINGGVLDEVWFVMTEFNTNTNKNVKFFVKTANVILGNRAIFHLEYLGFETTMSRPKIVKSLPYYMIFSDLERFPNNRYFKLDSDIIYIHPGAFEVLIERKNSSKCFTHFFNIAGPEWRYMYLHQRNKVYDGQLNNLTQTTLENETERHVYMESMLRTFIHHYEQKQLGKYFLNDLELLEKQKCFSISAFLLDRDLIDISALMSVGPIVTDPELWWTEDYAAKVDNPNCVVGEALVVYFPDELMHRNHLLQMFEDIVRKNKSSFKIEEVIWKVLEYE